MASLKEIKQPVANEIDVFEDKFRQALKSDVALLDNIMKYIVKRKGKQVRPLLVFLSAKILGPVTESTYRGASLVELLHTATLVHDDVVDDSLERRGFFSINALWKNKIAVLIGDYLLSKGLLLSLDNNDFKLLKYLSDAVRRMSEGELLQIEKTRSLNITEEIYFEVISNKTASFISACCAVGASTVSSNQDQIELLKQFGEQVGIAFQIKDDLFDFGTENVGKPTGIDIKEKKMTLPLIYALNKADRAERNRIIHIVKSKTKDRDKIDEVILFVNKYKGLEYASGRMYEYRDKAYDLLKLLPQNEANSSLRMLVDYVVERKK